MNDVISMRKAILQAQVNLSFFSIDIMSKKNYLHLSEGWISILRINIFKNNPLLDKISYIFLFLINIDTHKVLLLKAFSKFISRLLRIIL